MKPDNQYVIIIIIEILLVMSEANWTIDESEESSMKTNVIDDDQY